MMNIRHSTMADLPDISDCYAYAREQMKLNGNPTQWGNSSPAEALILGDIQSGHGYVIEENGVICGVFAFIIGPEPTYQEIWNGQWLNDDEYGTIHRLASNGKSKGIFEACLQFCESLCPNIRTDTHIDNAPMQHLLPKFGFQRCGTIRVANGTLRTAFQKIC